MPLDELVGAPPVGDPRIDPEPFTRHGVTYVPLTRQAGGIRAYKQILPVGHGTGTLDLGVHEGYEWLYVLSGRLRLVLADRDMVLTAGEAAEFDTHVPHGFGNAGRKPVELLSLFGVQGSACTCGRRRRIARPAARRTERLLLFRQVVLSVRSPSSRLVVRRCTT